MAVYTVWLLPESALISVGKIDGVLLEQVQGCLTSGHGWFRQNEKDGADSTEIWRHFGWHY